VRRLIISLDKLILLFLFLIIVVLGIDGGRSSNIFALSEGKVRMFMFYAEDCSHCQSIINEFLPELKKKYGPIIEVKYFEIGEPKNYELLREMEREYGDTSNEIPAIFIDSFVLGSGEEIEENLDSIVGQCISKGGCDWPPLPEGTLTEVKEISPASNKVIHLIYFSRPGCKECQRVRYLLNHLKLKYSYLQIEEYDLSLKESKELEVNLCIKYGVPRKKWLVSPVIFVGEDYLLEDKVNDVNLEMLLSKYSERGTIPLSKVERGLSGAQETLVNEFRSWRFLSVMVAGLIDGINPCAFAVIIFFVSWLVLIRQRGKMILAVGLIYTLAVFFAYFLVGVGLLRFIQALVVFPLISMIIYLMTAFFALILGFLNLGDYFKAKEGNWKEIKLQLPEVLKKKIHKVTRQFMGENVKLRTHLLIAFVAGFIISLFEFPCTGQIYLPTIVFISEIPALRSSALSYLLFYNLMFIIPLVIVFGFTYWGTSVPRLVQILEKNVPLIKILTAFFFFTLAGYLIYIVI